MGQLDRGSSRSEKVVKKRIRKNWSGMHVFLTLHLELSWNYFDLSVRRNIRNALIDTSGGCWQILGPPGDSQDRSVERFWEKSAFFSEDIFSFHRMSQEGFLTAWGWKELSHEALFTLIQKEKLTVWVAEFIFTQKKEKCRLALGLKMLFFGGGPDMSGKPRFQWQTQ